MKKIQENTALIVTSSLLCSSICYKKVQNEKMNGKEQSKAQLKQELIKIKQTDYFIIVEGKNDKKKLVQLGFNANYIFCLHAGKNLDARIEQLLEKCKGQDRILVIMTDGDKKGMEMYKKIKHVASQFGTKIYNDKALRKLLACYSHIESIPLF